MPFTWSGAIAPSFGLSPERAAGDAGWRVDRKATVPDPFDLITSTSTGSLWIRAVLAAGLVAAAGMEAEALSASGALAAVVVGSVFLGAGGTWTAVLVVVFFVSSSALSHYHGGYPAYVYDFATKAGRRDAAQVLANGGFPALLTLGAAIADDPTPWLIAAAGAIAGACADTWATEIGKTSERLPRMITTWRYAQPGTSGAVSVLGTIGALGGATAIGLTASIGAVQGWWPPSGPGGTVLVVVTGAGFAGALVDSIAGATLQAQYRCEDCKVLTERTAHTCGVYTDLERGYPYVTNDVVNAIASAASGAVAATAVGLIAW